MILNLTQHKGTLAQGVTELADATELKRLLTFVELPTRAEVAVRAAAIAELALAEGTDTAMIGGAPYLMGPLERALQERGITPLYAFSERRSVEQTNPETGEVTKATVFAHLGFVEA